MKQFMRLILYVILDVFIQGGGAGTGLLWAAQVKLKRDENCHHIASFASLMQMQF